jgi:hypothetical protein
MLRQASWFGKQHLGTQNMLQQQKGNWRHANKLIASLSPVMLISNVTMAMFNGITLQNTLHSCRDWAIIWMMPLLYPTMFPIKSRNSLYFSNSLIIKSRPKRPQRKKDQYHVTQTSAHDHHLQQRPSLPLLVHTLVPWTSVTTIRH